jgi:hypothetical protein
MNRSFEWCALPSMLLALAGIAGEAHAQRDQQYLPGGSYRDSCTNISVRQNRISGLMLHATCTDRHGVPIQSSIDLPCAAAENDNGRLKCEYSGGEPDSWAGPPVPPGSYRNSCESVSVRSDRSGRPVLIAYCTDRRGTVMQSSLFLPCEGNISNDDGRLYCEGVAPGPAIVAPPYGQSHGQPPAGTYLRSCVDVVAQYQGGGRGVLHATCSDRNGRYTQSSLYLPCGGTIENDNGRLRCGD